MIFKITVNEKMMCELVTEGLRKLVFDYTAGRNHMVTGIDSDDDIKIFNIFIEEKETETESSS